MTIIYLLRVATLVIGSIWGALNIHYRDRRRDRVTDSDRAEQVRSQSNTTHPESGVKALTTGIAAVFTLAGVVLATRSLGACLLDHLVSQSG